MAYDQFEKLSVRLSDLADQLNDEIINTQEEAMFITRFEEKKSSKETSPVATPRSPTKQEKTKSPKSSPKMERKRIKQKAVSQNKIVARTKNAPKSGEAYLLDSRKL